jgi:hypothetical protein
MTAARKLMYGLENKQGATSWEVRRGGVQGELAKMRSDHFGDYAERRVTLATQQPPSWQPVATNSDFASLAQSTTVSGVLDYYYRELRIERHLEQALDDLQWGGEGFVLGGWDVRKGEVIAADPETGEKINEGDLEFHNLTALDVVRDIQASSYRALSSKIARVPVNKWDLAARYPEKEGEILKVEKDWADAASWNAGGPDLETDEIYLFYLLHDRTDALPEGRMVSFVSGGGVLFDGPLPFRNSPLMRATESELRGTPFGWTAMFRCLGPQEVVDALTTAITTNQVNHAVNKIVGIKGSGLSYKMLSQALAYLEVKDPSHIPVPINFSQTPGDVFQFRKDHIAEMGMFSGVNEIQRGVVNPAIKSGAHAALFDAIGNRNNSRLQRAHYTLAEDIGTFILHTLADYAGDSERTARISGEANRSLITTFKGQDLEGFDRVTVEATSHAAKTVTGKQAIADTLLEKGALGAGELAGQRYMQMIKTGDYEQMTEAPRADNLRRKRAMEMLAKGQPINVLATDRHWLDIPEYLTVLATPEAREDARVVLAVNTTVMAALDHWRMMDPDLRALLGGPPPPSQTMVPPPPPGEASNTTPPKPGSGSATSNPNELNPTDVPAGQPQMPRLPGSDEQYEPAAPEAPPLQ